MIAQETLIEATGTDPLALLALADEHEDAGHGALAQIRRLQYRLRAEAATLSDQERKPLEAELIRLSWDCPPPVHEVVNSIGMRLAQIPAGLGWIGSPEDEPGRYDDEGPRHRVRFGSFFLGVYPVTQEQYQKVMGTNPSHFRGDNLPVETVSWHDAVEFCRRLSALPAERAAGRVYRLPHEKEWEYACRGNVDCHPYAFGESLTNEMANFGGDNKGTTPVGQYKPNTFGLYDMHGNVWEWCGNAYTSRYEEAGEEDPFLPSGVPAGTTSAISAGQPTASGPGRSTGATTSASASVSEGEQSDPFACSEAATGATSAGRAGQPTASGPARTSGSTTSASASSAQEGEKSDPFEASAAEAGQSSAMAADRDSSTSGQRSFGATMAASASAQEASEEVPFGRTGAAAGLTAARGAGQPIGSVARQMTRPASSASASSAPEGEDSVPFGSSGDATGATFPDTAGRRIAAPTSLDAAGAASSASASASEVVIRGGCAGGWNARSAIRAWEYRGYGGGHLGFRILATNSATIIS